MEIIKSSSALNYINFQNPFAFVPTMGNLHEGHLSLIKFAKDNYSEVITSIFVNPLQFGKNEDFTSYPKTLDKDIELLEDLECNYLFLPEPNFAENLKVINPNFSDVLCGLSRPTHFHGVLTIIDKFLRLIKPNACLFGLKDYQQQLIIRDYVHRKKLRTEIISLPIVRENSGLAMSSRNNYLSKDDREYCGKIYFCIKNTAIWTMITYFLFVLTACILWASDHPLEDDDFCTDCDVDWGSTWWTALFVAFGHLVCALMLASSNFCACS